MKKFQPQPGFVVQAFRFALDPNASQEAALRSHCGAARAAYNWAVGWVTASWWQRHAEESYGVPEAELTQWRSWSLPSLRKAFNEAKKTDPRFSAWWEQNSKEEYSTGLANASAAFDNHAKSKNGQTARQAGRCAAVQAEAEGTPCLPVHHRHHPRRRRRPARHTAEAGHTPHPRAHRQPPHPRAGPDGTHPVRDRPARARTLVRLVPGRGQA